MNILTLPIPVLQEKMLQRELSATEICQAFIARIGEVENRVQAYVYLDLEHALAQAKQVDKKIAKKMPLGALFGIPMAVKAAMNTQRMPTSACCSRLIHHHVTDNAPVIQRLLAADAILLGKNNMDQLSMGSSTITSCFYPSKNPWDLSKTPGGSSGGGAAGVAALESCFALGSDTGGSIRQPASYCGLVGCKPSFGNIAAEGLLALAPTFDQIGPLTKTVADMACVLDVAVEQKPNIAYSKKITEALPHFTVGVPKEYFHAGLRAEVKSCVLQAVAVLEKIGLRVQEVSLPLTQYCLPDYCLLTPVEFLPIFDQLQEMAGDENGDWGLEVKTRVLTGAFLASEKGREKYYLPAVKMREAIKKEVALMWQKVDFLLTPSTLDVAFSYEQMPSGVQMRKSDELLAMANLTGIPAISLPCAFLDNMPVGMQFMAAYGKDDCLLQLAYAFEQESALKIDYLDLL